MKTDDFEEQLRQQPPRKLPPEWREQILQTARNAAEAPATVREFSGLHAAASFWRELLWPSPKAWGALACIWLLLCIANFALSELAPVSTPSGAVVELSPEKVKALKEQRLLKAELFEMTDSISATASSAPKPRTKLEAPFTHA